MKRYVKPKTKVHVVAIQSIMQLSASVESYNANNEALTKDRGDNEWEEF